MPTVIESVEINRPIQEVFDFASNPDNQMIVSSNMLEYEVDRPPQKGQRARGITKVAGRRVEWTSETVEFDPPRTYAIRSLEAPMGFTIEYRFEDISNGKTRVTFTQEVDSLGGFFGKLSDPLVTRMYAHDVRSNLHHLKELLEEA